MAVTHASAQGPSTRTAPRHQCSRASPALQRPPASTRLPRELAFQPPPARTRPRRHLQQGRHHLRVRRQLRLVQGLRTLQPEDQPPAAALGARGGDQEPQPEAEQGLRPIGRFDGAALREWAHSGAHSRGHARGAGHGPCRRPWRSLLAQRGLLAQLRLNSYDTAACD